MAVLYRSVRCIGAYLQGALDTVGFARFIGKVRPWNIGVYDFAPGLGVSIYLYLNPRVTLPVFIFAFVFFERSPLLTRSIFWAISARVRGILSVGSALSRCQFLSSPRFLLSCSFFPSHGIFPFTIRSAISRGIPIFRVFELYVCAPSLGWHAYPGRQSPRRG